MEFVLVIFLVVFMMNEENWLCRMRTSRLSFHHGF